MQRVWEITAFGINYKNLNPKSLVCHKDPKTLSFTMIIKIEIQRFVHLGVFVPWWHLFV